MRRQKLGLLLTNDLLLHGTLGERGRAAVVKWCLMSSDVSWHIRDKLWPMPKHGSINLYVHGKPEGSLGRTAQDVHLDSHTAPELWGRGGAHRTSFNTLDNWGHKTPTPQSKKRRTTGKKRLTGHGPEHTQYTRLHNTYLKPQKEEKKKRRRSRRLSLICQMTSEDIKHQLIRSRRTWMRRKKT